MSKVIFQRYIQIAEVLGQMFPNILEVVVHDFSNLDQSVIFIVNGQVSNRTIGSNASELGLRRLLGNENIPDILVNYTNITERGNRLKSSSLAIRNDKGKMIGAFCLNFDTAGLEYIHTLVNSLIKFEISPVVGETELAPKASVMEELQQIIQDYLIQKNRVFSTLSSHDKQNLVDHLRQKGIFKQRGAVNAVANTLKLTRQSIYNYLKKGKS